MGVCEDSTVRFRVLWPYGNAERSESDLSLNLLRRWTANNVRHKRSSCGSRVCGAERPSTKASRVRAVAQRALPSAIAARKRRWSARSRFCRCAGRVSPCCQVPLVVLRRALAPPVRCTYDAFDSTWSRLLENAAEGCAAPIVFDSAAPLSCRRLAAAFDTTRTRGATKALFGQLRLHLKRARCVKTRRRILMEIDWRSFTTRGSSYVRNHKNTVTPEEESQVWLTVRQ